MRRLKQANSQHPIVVPPRSLVVLCGVSGCGKSALVERDFTPTQIVSSDQCRAILSDDPSNQFISHKAFELMHWIVDERLHLRRTTVVDSTALSKRARAPLLKMADRHGAYKIIVCLDLPIETCLRRDLQRERTVGREVIERQYEAFQKALVDIRTEGWDRVVVLNEREADNARFFQQRGSFDLRYLSGPFDIIGDVHGCTDELSELLDKLGYVKQGEQGLRHPEGRRLIFLGDMADRGPHNADAFALAMELVEAGVALYTPGNHCNKLMRHLQGKKVQLTHGLKETVEQVEERNRREPDFKERLRRFIESAPTYLWLADGELVVPHAGIKEHMIGKNGPRVRTMCLYGDITGETNPDGTPVRLDWAEHYSGSAAIVYGHTPVAGPVWKNNTINIDQGCVFGGWLTALRWPEREIAQVRARAAYYTARTPDFLVGELSDSTLATPAQERAPR